MIKNITVLRKLVYKCDFCVKLTSFTHVPIVNAPGLFILHLPPQPPPWSILTIPVLLFAMEG